MAFKYTQYCKTPEFRLINRAILQIYFPCKIETYQLIKRITGVTQSNYTKETSQFQVEFSRAVTEMGMRGENKNLSVPLSTQY